MSAEPLTAEYAKSGKSGCKGCQKTIAKGELRVGFVGKANFGATAWYHYDCVWTDYGNLKSIDSSKSAKSIVQGYTDLKEEDMKKLDIDLPKFCKAAVEKAAAAAKVPPLPMATEYAKSAKSSCQGCSKSIDKGALRVGFNGKANFGTTAWYHYDCVWKDYANLKSIDSSKAPKALIQGYADLKEEDQKKLKVDLPKFCKSAVEKASELAKLPKPAMAAEYAKSAKSSCKGCSKNIEKGALRVGFTGKANFGATAWYHYDCVWKDNENLKSVDNSKAVEMVIEGYSDLQEGDKDKIKGDLSKYCKPSADKRKGDASKDGPSAAKKSK